MNKRKPDDEFALINLSYFDPSNQEVVVHCPETKGVAATLEPSRRQLSMGPADAAGDILESTGIADPLSETETTTTSSQEAGSKSAAELQELHYTINYGDTGHTYDSIVGPYLRGARELVVEDPYIRAQHQIANFVRFCETVVKTPTVSKIHLITSYESTRRWRN